METLFLKTKHVCTSHQSLGCWRNNKSQERGGWDNLSWRCRRVHPALPTEADVRASLPSKIQSVLNIFYKLLETDIFHSFSYFSLLVPGIFRKLFFSAFVTFILNNFFFPSKPCNLVYQWSRWAFANFSLVLNNWGEYKRSSTFSSIIVKHQS